MRFKPVCPKCLKLAFEYYIGDTVDLMKKDIVFPEPIPCDHCGYKIDKIEKGSGTIKRINYE